MGLALCAAFVVDKHTGKDDYQGSCRLEKGRSHCVGFNMSLDFRSSMMPGTHQLLVCYIPREVIPKLFIQTPSEQICTSYVTRSPGVRVQICGLRVLYQQDLPEFVHTITRCIFHSSGAPAEVYNKSMVEDWLNHKVHTSRNDYKKQKDRDFQFISQNYRNQDWSTVNFACIFPGIEIPKWFRNMSKSDTAQIQLSPSLFYDDNWMGVAVCASLSIHEHPYSESSRRDLFCYLDANVAYAGTIRFMFPADKEMWSHACNFICFVYLPRVLFPESWNQSDQLKATIGSGNSGLGVQNCTLRLVLKEDVEDLIEMLIFCHLSANCPHCEQAQEHNQKRVGDTRKD